MRKRWRLKSTVRSGGWLFKLAALALPTQAAHGGELLHQLQWDSSLALRGLTLAKQAQLLSWNADFYTEGRWGAYMGLQRSVRHRAGAQRLGLSYSLAVDPGELQLGWQAQGYSGDPVLKRWNYQQLHASWLGERCAISASWTLESSAAARLGYKGAALDIACLQPLYKQVGLELGAGVLRSYSTHRYGHAGLGWRGERMELRMLYSGAAGAVRLSYPKLAEARWHASAAWNF